MFTSLNDLPPFKSLESDNRLKAKPAKETSTEGSVSQDRFDLSSTSQQLDALIASLKDEPEVNVARVMYFKAEMELGNYQIDSQKIAKKLLNQVEMA